MPYLPLMRLLFYFFGNRHAETCAAAQEEQGKQQRHAAGVPGLGDRCRHLRGRRRGGRGCLGERGCRSRSRLRGGRRCSGRCGSGGRRRGRGELRHPLCRHRLRLCDLVRRSGITVVLTAVCAVPVLNITLGLSGSCLGVHMLQRRVVGRVLVAVGLLADITMRRRRAGGRAAGMVVADERAAICGEAALDRDHAIVREGVARTDRQGRALRDDERLARVQRCIAKQCRIADDRAGIAVEEYAVGNAAVDGILVVRLDPGACYSGRTIRSDGIVVFSFADLHSAVLNRNIPTREDSCISGGGCLDLTP